MHIQTLTLNNYRGAQSLSLDLDSRLNVFVGVNGAGKSTVLDAATILLSWVVNRIRTAGSSGRPIAAGDITNGQLSASIELTGIHENEIIVWRLAKARKGSRVSGKPTNLKPLSPYIEAVQDQLQSENAALPLFAYYPVNRAVLDIPLRIKSKNKFDLLAAYTKALESDTSFRTFFEWYRSREDLENELKILGMEGSTLMAKRINQYPDPQLEAVRNALYQFLPKFSNLRVRRSPLRMEIEKNGEVLTVNQLSDGEKYLIALISDLARRLAIANPTAENPLTGEGIVLIDEIDLHLHPNWQRIVVPKLLEIFPNCQFIVSTQSPHLLTHIHPGNIFLLEQTNNNITAPHPSESYGRTTERILEDLMGLETTRPILVKENLQAIYEMIARSQLEAARQGVTNLKSSIGSDPELARAEVLIKRKELIGR